jgi:phosphoglycolate phosphatase
MVTYFFDLDGTLTDSRDGLFASFQVGLDAIGACPVPEQAMQSFLGMPLPQVFTAAKPGVTQNEIDRGIAAFRRFYEAEGIFLNVLYPGVGAMLKAIVQRGEGAWVVTSKPQQHADRVVGILGLNGFIDGVVGAGLDETDTKTDLVARALSAARASPQDTFMLGDRSFDVIGAQDNSVTAVGALWGYGGRTELKDAGCRHFVASPHEFTAQYVMSPGLVAAAG